MRVRKLELFGFKSFAVKTTVQFEPGVTAIVGPNGSGKSNIVDSVRWVLGEHNPRDVRAPRLEDIIFNGTDTKAPLSMAEVSLLIDNDKGLIPISFSEVLITRRIYRSGESECFINHSPCRLRDIHELFLGTGLGGGTYAIITQGHIDLVLSSKPEERRVVFEEASGVAKYLSKRDEALRRLEEVEEHLVRVADIAGEVKRQLSALERQANKARQYKSQWDQLKHWEIHLAVDELRQGRQAQQTLTEAAEAMKRKRQALEDERRRSMESIESWNSRITATHAALQDLGARLVETSSRIEQHTEQRALKARWIDELAQQNQRLEREQIQTEERINVLGAQAQQLEAERASFDHQHEELGARRLDAQQSLQRVDEEIASQTRQADEAKARLFAAASDASQRRNELSSLAHRLQGLDAQQRRIAAHQQTARQRAEAVGQRQQSAQQEHAELRVQEQALQEQLAAARQSLAHAQAECDESMGRVRQAREQFLQQQAKTTFLDEMARRDESVPEAVKALLADPPDGVVGLVADLVNPQPGYEHALESALGELTMAIVVRDRDALARCHATLSKQEVEARFVVLSDCPTVLAAAPADPTEGSLGMLRQYVHCDPAHETLVAWLLGPWGLVGDLTRYLSSGWEQASRVSKSGDRWDGRSWRFLGTTKPFARVGLLRRLEQARQDLATLQQQMHALQTAWGNAESQCKTLAAQDRAAKERLDQLVPQRAKLDAQLAQFEHEASRLAEELRSIEHDAQQCIREQAELTQARAQAAEAVARAEAEHQVLDTALKDTQRRAEEIAQGRQQYFVTLAQLDASLAALQQQQARVEHRRRELTAEREQLQLALQEKRSQTEAVVARSAELAAQLDEHRVLIESSTAAQAALQTERNDVAARLSEEERERDQVLPSLLAVEQELNALSQQLEDHERQLAERSFRKAHVLERLREVYRVDEEALKTEEHAYPALSADGRASMSEQVDRLKSKLQSLGPVSLGSVEEYDELAKRQEFLKTQHDDLVKSRDDLKNSISQINRSARTQFRETFAIIRQEFQAYFKKLFGGGEADLILLDEEDVLESGIEIVARPPGKRLQSISLLSGGERALTAIALLFALFKVRPSPFCILDEIDAPLDEANVDRFTRVLEEFLSLSQFILITHNKKTITKADSLYGVTMEQPGMSKIVSVKLKTRAQPSSGSAPTPSSDHASPTASPKEAAEAVPA